MMRIPSLALPILALTLVAGCSTLDRLTGTKGPVPAAPPPAAAAPAPAPVLGAGKSAAALDRTTAEQKAAALSAPAKSGERQLGKVVVALGPPSEGGLWLKAPVVRTAGRGRVLTAQGQSLAVDIEPSESGALLSFGAFRALNLPLTGLPEVTVFAE